MATRFSVSLSDSISSEDARSLLDRLANDDNFRAEVMSNPQNLYDALGMEVGEGLIPDRVVLPLKRELQEANEILASYEEFRFKFEPFGFFTPGSNPFIGIFLLAARANSVDTRG